LKPPFTKLQQLYETLARLSALVGMSVSERFGAGGKRIGWTFLDGTVFCVKANVECRMAGVLALTPSEGNPPAKCRRDVATVKYGGHRLPYGCTAAIDRRTARASLYFRQI